MTMVILSQDRDRDTSHKSSHEAHWMKTMYHHGKELCFLLAITLTCYAALHSQPPKVSNIPVAVPFLRPSTVVDDFYTGELKTALKKMLLSEMSFVMYYAPWDAESQRVRWHFEAAARYFHKEIYFAAINCWQPGSECRQNNKIYTFPLLVLTPQRSGGQKYRGVREVSHIIRFLKTALRPVSTIHNQTDLAYKLTEHDAVVLCNLNFRDFKDDASVAYNIYFEAARKFLDQDQLNDIAFTVALDPDGNEFGEVPDAALIRIFLWNETITFNSSIDSWSSDSITQWVVKVLHQATGWVQPPGVKSLTLSSYLKSKPVLVLFTPRNPLLRHVYYYNLLREVAFSFYNCDDNEWVNELTDAAQIVRPRIQHHYRKLLQSCASWARDINERAGVTQVFSIKHGQMDPMATYGNVSRACSLSKEKPLVPPRSGFDYGYCGLLDYGADIPIDDVIVEEEPMFRRFFNYLGIGRKQASIAQRHDFTRLQKINDAMFNGLTSQLMGLGDPLWAEELQQWVQLERCRQLRHARLLDKPYFPVEKELEEGDYGVKGLSCSGNKTLSFLAFDSLQLHHFAERLGVDVLHRKDKSAVLIVDSQAETQYLLQGEINKVTLTKFIKDYVSDNLPRWHRTADTQPRALDFSLGPTQTIHLSRYSARNPDECEENAVCVDELNYSNFKSEVLENKKNVVLLYYTPYCAFCNAVSHVFLTVAHTLKSMSTLKFARIDGDNNDLPWEFTVHRFPSILFFPSRLKSDSYIFPASTEITVQNLVQFILSNLTPEERVWALLVVCEKGAQRQPLSFQDQLSVEKCMTQVKIEVFQSASQLVNKYRCLVVNSGEGTDNESSQALRRSLQRQLAARLRFFRQASSTLMSVSFSKQGQSRLTIVRDTHKQIRDAFLQLQEIQNELASPKSVGIEEIFKLNVDLNDVNEKLRSLNSTIETKQNGTYSDSPHSKTKDEL
ncbi:Thioredoxin domain-containing protein 11 [Frankliniella fusca]|uniref:Thioredoxin domain-containing protein 11 n=1 Tax=Frankliniella fusca TaxID=407009 RepID=A0AAE1LA63_9NEOP|nr:Thioredoxin domain-containing protein 11 [Frankliniella fusca]